MSCKDYYPENDVEWPKKIMEPLIKQELPTEQAGFTYSRRVEEIGGVRVHVTFGDYADGTLGKISIKAGLEGGYARAYSVAGDIISLSLQYGVPLVEIVELLEPQQLEPAGITTDPAAPLVKSVWDFVAKVIKGRYLNEEQA